MAPRSYRLLLLAATAIASVAVAAPASAITPHASSTDLGIRSDVLADAPRIAGTFSARVIDADGAHVVGVSMDRPMVPASTMKVITAINAYSALGPEHRFTTRVVSGGSRRALVLVGGGDPLLDRADLARLASRTADALQSRGVTSVTVRLDDRLYPEPTSAAGWMNGDSPTYAAPVRPLGLIGDYSGDTSANAAAVFVDALHGRGIEARYGGRTSSPTGARTIATVRPHTVAEAVRTMLVYSENNVAEQLFRHVALATGRTPSWEGSAAAARSQMERLRIPSRGVVVHDGSGLSMDDRLTARTLTVALRMVVDGTQPSLESLRSALPIAGRTGTLANRFWSSTSACAVGEVFAKTGSLSGVQTLAGITRGADGRWKVFALMSNDLQSDARPVMDEMAAEINGCQ